MLTPRCRYPACLADATHRLYYHPRRHVWMSQRYRHATRRWCRWHATVLATRATAQGVPPMAVLAADEERGQKEAG